MNKRSLSRVSNLRGFTLIELLLVRVILGILAGIVIPSYNGKVRMARITATFTQIANLKNALAAYEVANGKYPPGKSGLQDLVVRPRDSQAWNGPYIEQVPVDSWDHPFIYECPGKHNPESYDIISMGPDEKLGTEDDIANWTRPGSVK